MAFSDIAEMVTGVRPTIIKNMVEDESPMEQASEPANAEALEGERPIQQLIAQVMGQRTAAQQALEADKIRQRQMQQLMQTLQVDPGQEIQQAVASRLSDRESYAKKVFEQKYGGGGKMGAVTRFLIDVLGAGGPTLREAATMEANASYDKASQQIAQELQAQRANNSAQVQLMNQQRLAQAPALRAATDSLIKLDTNAQILGYNNFEDFKAKNPKPSVTDLNVLLGKTPPPTTKLQKVTLNLDGKNVLGSYNPETGITTINGQEIETPEVSQTTGVSRAWDREKFVNGYLDPFVQENGRPPTGDEYNQLLQKFQKQEVANKATTTTTTAPKLVTQRNGDIKLVPTTTVTQRGPAGGTAAPTTPAPATAVPGAPPAAPQQRPKAAAPSKTDPSIVGARPETSAERQQFGNASSGLAAIHNLMKATPKQLALARTMPFGLGGGTVLTDLHEATDVIKRMRSGAATNAYEEKLYDMMMPTLADLLQPEVIKYKLARYEKLFMAMSSRDAAKIRAEVYSEWASKLNGEGNPKEKINKQLDEIFKKKAGTAR